MCIRDRIYIDDLKPDIQRQVLEELGLETAEDGDVYKRQVQSDQ